MKGILFEPWKIKAIADSLLDREWQTRRIGGLEEINKEPDAWCIAGYKDGVWGFGNLHCEDDVLAKPRYHIGETVYIKEGWYHRPDGKVSYKADYPNAKASEFRTPLFMPAWAARYFIQITDVRAERLGDIKEADCIAEGIEDIGAGDLQGMFAVLWDTINKLPYGWNGNPYVFVYSFKRVEK